MNDAAALVAKLAEAGTPPELLAAVAKELFAGETAREVIEERRHRDRVRKTPNPRNSEEARGNPRSSTESAEIREQGVSKVSPQTPLPNLPQSPPLAPKGASPQIFVEAWNSMAERTGLPAVKSLTNERVRRLKARISDHGPDRVLEAIKAVGKSRFCLGDNDRGWRADFDFVLQPKSCARLIEGSYGNTENERLTV